MTLFDPGPEDAFVLGIAGPEQGPTLSPDARRTLRNRLMLARGEHPVTHRALANNGHTCGDCAHHFVHSVGHTFHKCDLNATRGPATDVRVSWPACVLWEAQP